MEESKSVAISGFIAGLICDKTVIKICLKSYSSNVDNDSMICVLDLDLMDLAADNAEDRSILKSVVKENGEKKNFSANSIFFIKQTKGN